MPESLDDAIAACRAAGFDLVIVETPGHRPGRRRDRRALRPVALRDDPGVRGREPAREDRHARLRRRGGDQQVRAPRRRGRAARRAPAARPQPRAVRSRSGVAAGVRDHRLAVQRRRRHRPLPAPTPRARRDRAFVSTRAGCPAVDGKTSSKVASIVPPDRTRYLAEIAEAVRAHHATTESRSQRPPASCSSSSPPAMCSPIGRRPPTTWTRALDGGASGRRCETRALLDGWPAVEAELDAVPGRESQSGNVVPRVALPRYDDAGELLRFLRSENVPGRFPFTAGVFPLKREGEDPARMFAGEGDAFRTNRRFHLLQRGPAGTRLSTAFDSVTLYGFDPDERPDIYGKVGQLRRVDRHPRRHARALRRLRPDRPDHVRVDDDQRARPPPSSPCS